jgi:DNA-directed RNA polymerase specialized sigma24 family protein
MSNYWCSHIVLDPADIERMFSNEDGLSSYPGTTEELSDESKVELEQVKNVLDQIPPREADFVELYFFQKIRQTTIASLFNISQPTVCYRLQRAASRIRYLLDMPNYDPWLMEQDLRGVLTDPMDIKIMTQMVITTCQSEVAKSLGVTQGFVRHRYFRTIDRLKKMRGMEQYVHVFEHVAANLNILKETHRSKWAEPVIYVVAENPTGVSR